MLRCIAGIFAERRFLLCFGALYVMSVVTLLHKTSVMDVAESQIDVVHTDGDIPVNRKDRSLPKSNQDKPSNTSTAPKVNLTRHIPGGPKLANLNCQNLPSPKFLLPGEMPLTALHSFPGSGNTWVRVLLASLTGINTGDIYRDGAFAKTPGFTYKKDDTVIAVKTHHPFWDDNNGPDPSAPKGRYWERAIIIIRHPLDATISVYNWFRMRGSHTKTASIEKYLTANGKPTKEWNKWAHDQIRNWGRCIDYWINSFKGPKLVVFYEDLVADLRTQLQIMNDFLGRELDERRLECTVQSQAQQKFHRKATVDKRLVYDSSMLDEVEIVLEKATGILKKNYTHTHSGFSLPANYAVNLVRENFSLKPNTSHAPQP